MRPKPLYGDPCNRCGMCCILSQCPLSLVMYGRQRICPALTPDGLGGHVCGLVAGDILKPAERTAAVVATGGGLGCDYTDTKADYEAREVRKDALLAKARQLVTDLPPAARRHLERWRKIAAR